MKKLKSLMHAAKIVFAMSTVLLFVQVGTTFAQDTTGQDTTIVTPGTGGAADVTAELIKSYFGNISLLAALTLIVCMFLRTKIKGFNLQFTSWVIAFALAFIGYAMHWGMFESLSIGWTAAAGLGAALIANGIADTPLIQAIYDVFKNK